MTREEAIEEIRYYCADSEEIIKALEQEPTTKNDLGVDCIDRQIISDYVESHIQEINTGYGDLNRHTNSILRMIVDYIENMTSVTPQEPRKGHWIGHREHCENLGVMPSGLGVYKWCSNCDCGIDVGEWDRNPYNYCPNCGADMRGEE